MPTVWREGGLRIYFVSHDCREPAHVHVDRGRDASAKLWLRPVAIARNIGYAAHELNAIVRLVRRRRDGFLRIWDEHCGRPAD